MLKNALLIIASIALPIMLSLLIGFSQIPGKGGQQFVIVQPNIDPYNEKFNGDFVSQLNKMLDLAKQKVNSSTDYLIFPETALTEDSWEDQLKQSTSIHVLSDFLKSYPKLKIITGASTNKLFKPGEPLSSTARKFTMEDGYYDSYNTALQLDAQGELQIYHKSKLVLGVEKMPFPWLLKPFEKLAIDLGGTMGTLGSQDEPSVFHSNNSSGVGAPVICYESIYGEYVGEYVKKGANFIAIITNDGWWGDTPGYHQHLAYGRLRAIETRRWIVRSANTGISAFISPSGEIQQPTSWWVPDVIAQSIQLNSGLTFYVRYGDYLGKAAACSALALLLYSFLIRFRNGKKS
jgi:apolipoprotein N-acyltransferase